MARQCAIAATCSDVTFRHDLDIVEKRFNKLEEFQPCGRKREWSSLKQLGAERLLQLRDLPADRRLLDAVRDVTHRGCDPAVLRDEVKQLKVMNVHDRKGR